ncbi:hypothetical protein H2199_000263 [Coniosporium tulheliwenetii]|uniref:Uncharacterized protein n=1 Tax=Coniosporium tulheliwenetii TaxID=3383036 RepID=A0ACC2ZPP2_9PEZI|nr:hypothetical protein H2199_000263 [Cladosporium sp. JES 115]
MPVAVVEEGPVRKDLIAPATLLPGRPELGTRLSSSHLAVGDPDGDRHSKAGSQWRRDTELVSLSTAQNRVWHNHLSNVPRKALRQVLGLNPFKTSYITLYRPLKDFQSRMILLAGVILAVAAGVPLPIIGVIFGRIIDSFPPSEAELETRIGQLLGVAAAYFVITWGWAVCWGIIGERVSRGLRESLVERALGMELAYFDTEAPDMTNILTEKTQTIQLGTSEKVGLFIQSISYFVAAFTVGFILNATLTGILFVAVIPAMAMIVYLGTKTVSKFSKRAADLSEEAANLAESAIKGVQVVQAFGVLDKMTDDHLALLRRAVRVGVKKSIAGALMLGSVYFVAYAANALAFWEGRRLYEGAEGTSGGAGTIYAVVFLILDASFVVGQFGPFIQTFALAASAGEKIFEVLDHAESHINVYSDEGEEASTDTFKGEIRFQDVTFVYPARSNARVLEGLNLKFKAGRVNGLVGASGSGKSTIAALLLRFYDPSSGRVTIGGTDIRTFNVGSWRRQIALVDQNPVLFSGTILDNIRHGLGDNHGLSEQEVIRRCEKAAADANCDFISALPDELSTAVGGSGNTQLSGGQKQRLALARALVGEPSVLVLDEYTSAMDATSETLVLDALRRAAAVSTRTTIIIAHRLATIKEADKIMVMGEGTLLEEGTHDSLLELDGVYKQLVDAQSFAKSDSESESRTSAKSSSPEDSLKKLTPLGTSSSNVASEHSPAEPLSVSTLVRRCFALSRSERPFISLGILASMVSGAIIMGEAIVFGNLVHILNEESDSEGLARRANFFCLMFFVLSLIALVAYSATGSLFGVVSEWLILRVKATSLRTILQQDVEWFSEPSRSLHALMSSLSMDVGHLSGMSGIIIGTFFSVATSIIGGIVLAHIVAWKIAVVLLAAVPVMLLAGFLRLRVLSKAEERHETAYNEAAALASEACASIRTVAALGRESDVLRLYKEAIQEPYEQSLKFTIMSNVLLAFSLSITYFVYALAYWWGAKQVRNGNYTTLQFFVVLPALLFSAQAAGQMFSLAPELTRAKSAARSVFKLHDQRPSIITDSTSALTSVVSDSAELLEKGSDLEKPLPSKGQVDFKAVSLTYPSRPDAPALKEVTCSIQPGEFVAFVGRSGAGKTSSISLIERFFDPTGGAVLVNGKDIRDMPVEEHRARIGLVEQEPHLFPGSVLFNVNLGARPGREASHEEVVNVCKKCGIHDFIMGLPEGYNTECGKNGSMLSGGQRQRIAIARALIRDPEILLLDEATSQLDATSEMEVRNAIAAASSGRTTIVVAHRLASVQSADRIYVFDDGTIVEQGTHDDLVALGGIYAGMVGAQELG